MNSCAACGKKSEELLCCIRCSSVSYCNRKCQRLHWKVHKKLCKRRANANDDISETSTSRTSTSDSCCLRESTNESKRNQPENKLLRKLKKTVTHTAQGVVTPGEPFPKGVPTNFHFKLEAHACFSTGSPILVWESNENLGNLKYEKVYKNFYDEIVRNENDWMVFFDHIDNYEHAR